MRMSLHGWRLGLALGLVLVGGVFPLRSAPFLVTLTNDAGPGSLREAIATANAAGGGEIQFAVSGTIQLNTSLPPLLNLSLICPPTNTIIIRGTNTSFGSTNGFRLLTVPTSSTVLLKRITLMNSFGPPPGGGGILNFGTLIMELCTLTNNGAFFGGAIYSASGSVTLKRCNLMRNYAYGKDGLVMFENWWTPGEPGAGGAIYATNSLVSIAGCSFHLNQVEGGFGGPGESGSGGAINSINSLISISNSSFSVNRATGGNGQSRAPGRGGAIMAAGGNLTLISNLFSGNYAQGAYGYSTSPSYGGGGPGGTGIGGAVYAACPVMISGCQFKNNQAYGGFGGQGYGGGDGGDATGGAIAAMDSSTISNSVFIGNSAIGNEGGRGIRGGLAGNGGRAMGGGLWASNSVGNLIGCTFAQNGASGGDGADGGTGSISSISPGFAGNAQAGGVAIEGGSWVLVNCTVSANTAVPGIGGEFRNWDGQILFQRPTGVASGGGLWASGAVKLTNATVVINSASSSNSVGGGLFGGEISLRNCLIAGNTAESSFDATNVTSLGFNLVGQTNSLSNLTATDLVNANVGIGPLQDNGGPTPTHALLAGSPAINRGDSGGIAVDQRGFRRPIIFPGVPPVSTGEDIGAYEADSTLRMFRIVATTTNVSLGFLTVSDGRYRVEYTDSLSAPIWTAAMTAIQGNGGGVQVSFNISAVPNRFYRIVREN